MSSYFNNSNLIHRTSLINLSFFFLALVSGSDRHIWRVRSFPERNVEIWNFTKPSDEKNALLCPPCDSFLNLLCYRCGASFAVEIVSAQFEGKRLLERHRLVNTALEEEMKEIHALSIKKAVTPEQWKQQQESQNSKATA